MGDFIIRGLERISVGFPVVNWGSDPRFALSREDMRTAPTREVLQYVVHTTLGIPPTLVEGADRATPRAENVARFWSTSPDAAGAHAVFDSDGSGVQCAPLQSVIAWHARGSSMHSVGVEIYQYPDGRVFTASVESAAELYVALAVRGPEITPRISLVTPGRVLRVNTSYPERGRPVAGIDPRDRCALGHRTAQPRDRGRNDPGDAVMRRFADAVARRAAPHGLSVVEF